jgi:hypothetical protein
VQVSILVSALHIDPDSKACPTAVPTVRSEAEPQLMRPCDASCWMRTRLITPHPPVSSARPWDYNCRYMSFYFFFLPMRAYSSSLCAHSMRANT